MRSGVQLETLERQLNQQLTNELATHDPNAGSTDAAHQAVLRQQSDVQQRILRLDESQPAGSVLSTLTPARPVRVVNGGGLSAPNDPLTRLLLAGLIGLVIGIALAALVSRQSETVYGVPSIEAATLLPVISEIPYINAVGKRRYDVLTQVVPSSRLAEAYRGLRTTISMMWIANTTRARPTAPIRPSAPTCRKVLMVASPGPSEGKSTSTANLAACYAETGKRVIVIDLDQRRQKLHRFVGANAEPHVENLGTASAPIVNADALLQDTAIPGVQFVSSPERDAAPAESVAMITAVIAAVRDRADIILLDTPPLLLANAAYDIMSEADALLLLIHDGHTKRAAAARATQMLRRLDAPVLGVCVIGAVEHTARLWLRIRLWLRVRLRLRVRRRRDGTGSPRRPAPGTRPPQPGPQRRIDARGSLMSHAAARRVHRLATKQRHVVPAHAAFGCDHDRCRHRAPATRRHGDCGLGRARGTRHRRGISSSALPPGAEPKRSRSVATSSRPERRWVTSERSPRPDDDAGRRRRAAHDRGAFARRSHDGRHRRRRRNRVAAR